MKENTFIKPSKIHGLGVFALTDISKGEEIIQGKADMDNYRDEWINYQKSKQVSFCYWQGYCMINHSETPNAERGGEYIILANRDIKADEEITENYNALPDEQNPFKSGWLERDYFRFKHKEKR